MTKRKSGEYSGTHGPEWRERMSELAARKARDVIRTQMRRRDEKAWEEIDDLIEAQADRRERGNVTKHGVPLTDRNFGAQVPPLGDDGDWL